MPWSAPHPERLPRPRGADAGQQRVQRRDRQVQACLRARGCSRRAVAPAWPESSIDQADCCRSPSTACWRVASRDSAAFRTAPRTAAARSPRIGQPGRYPPAVPGCSQRRRAGHATQQRFPSSLLPPRVNGQWSSLKPRCSSPFQGLQTLRELRDLILRSEQSMNAIVAGCRQHHFNRRWARDLRQRRGTRCSSRPLGKLCDRLRSSGNQCVVVGGHPELVRRLGQRSSLVFRTVDSCLRCTVPRRVWSSTWLVLASEPLSIPGSGRCRSAPRWKPSRLHAAIQTAQTELPSRPPSQGCQQRRYDQGPP